MYTMLFNGLWSSAQVQILPQLKFEKMKLKTVKKENKKGGSGQK